MVNLDIKIQVGGQSNAFLTFFQQAHLLARRLGGLHNPSARGPRVKIAVLAWSRTPVVQHQTSNFIDSYSISKIYCLT
jgi:hypothetical protein